LFVDGKARKGEVAVNVSLRVNVIKTVDGLLCPPISISL
jgi:hypothetical protein